MQQRIKKFWRFLERPERTLVLDGGAGSGKSTSIAQFLCCKFASSTNTKFLAIRKTRPSLRITSYRLVKDILREMGIPFTENRSMMLLTFGTNEWHFVQMDDPEKIKSFEATWIWIEEATEIEYHDFLQLRMRLTRTDSANPHIILSFNPISSTHWCITELVNKPHEITEIDGGTAIHHSTYLDNPFLSQGFINDLKGLKDKDPNWYRIYALGIAGILSNVVYSKYDVIEFDKFPPEFHDGEPGSYGLDFGFTHPTALVSIFFREDEAYAHELIYESGLTSVALIARMNALNISRSIPIYCDSARPEMIADIQAAGYNARQANKSVYAGINAVRELRLTISAESVDLLKEIQGYHFLTKVDGTVTETPLKFKDDLLDALRYGIYTSQRSDSPTPSEDDVSHNYASVPLVSERHKPGVISRHKAKESKMYDDF
jgi:phage terminase large subunit